MQTTIPQAPEITNQPRSQSTRVGQTATFTVVARGTPPLKYQWSKNGAPIPGATMASYDTALAVPTDNGTVYAVTVSNSVGSITSASAALSVGPRAPKSGDLRFQQVAAPSTSQGLIAGGIHSYIYDGIGWSFQNTIGTPLSIGSICPGCIWQFSSFPLPQGVSGLSVTYQSFRAPSFPPDAKLDSLADGHSVINTVDLELNDNTWAASWIQSANDSGFQYFRQTIAPDQFQAVATQLGQVGRVVTALTFDSSGDVYFVN